MKGRIRTSVPGMAEAEEAGILTLVTPRRSHRVWAQPQMAQLLRMRASRLSGRAMERREKPEETGETSEDRAADVARPAIRPAASREEREARTAEALAALDEAMARADAILARNRKA